MYYYYYIILLLSSNFYFLLTLTHTALVKSRLTLEDMIMRLSLSPSCTLRQIRLRASSEMPGLMPSLWQTKDNFDQKTVLCYITE